MRNLRIQSVRSPFQKLKLALAAIAAFDRADAIGWLFHSIASRDDSAKRNLMRAMAKPEPVHSLLRSDAESRAQIHSCIPPFFRRSTTPWNSLRRTCASGKVVSHSRTLGRIARNSIGSSFRAPPQYIWCDHLAVLPRDILQSGKIRELALGNISILPDATRTIPRNSRQHSVVSKKTEPLVLGQSNHGKKQFYRCPRLARTMRTE